jgi:hypothetical protein
VHGPKPDHSLRIIDGYFEGRPPFKSKKERDDFPDAFIFASLQDVASTHQGVHAVITDKAFKEAASGVENVTVYSSLDDFVTSPDCQERIREANVVQSMEILQTYLRGDASALERIVNGHIASAIDGKEIESGVIPDDNSVSTITGAYEPSEVTFAINDAEYYGNGNVVVPFYATVEVLADYYVFKGDYYCIGDDRSQRISVSDWNDHYFAAQECFTVRVSGAVSIVFDQALLSDGTLDEERLASAISVADGEIDEVSDITVTWPTEDAVQ